MSEGDVEFIKLYMPDRWSLHGETLDWLNENVGRGGRGAHLFIVDAEMVWAYTLGEMWFKNETHALLFKLTWGGK